MCFSNFSLKCAALQQQEVAVKERLERRVAELERRLVEQRSSADSTAEVRPLTGT